MVPGLLFLSGMCLMLGLLGYFPRASDAERKDDRRSWRSHDPMPSSERVFRQRAYLLSMAAPALLVAGGGLLIVTVVVAVAR